MSKQILLFTLLLDIAAAIFTPTNVSFFNFCAIFFFLLIFPCNSRPFVIPSISAFSISQSCPSLAFSLLASVSLPLRGLSQALLSSRAIPLLSHQSLPSLYATLPYPGVPFTPSCFPSPSCLVSSSIISPCYPRPLVIASISPCLPLAPECTRVISAAYPSVPACLRVALCVFASLSRRPRLSVTLVCPPTRLTHSTQLGAPHAALPLTLNGLRRSTG